MLLGKDPAKIAAALSMTEADLKAGADVRQHHHHRHRARSNIHGDMPKIVVDDVDATIDAALSAGRITQAQADAVKADAKTHADDIVNGKAPLRPGPAARGNCDQAGRPGGFGHRPRWAVEHCSTSTWRS